MIRLTVCALLAAVSMFAGIKKVVEGTDFFLLLQDDGVVLGFGDCSFGRLANTQCQYEKRLIPIRLPGKAIDIATAQWTSFAVLEDGSVMSWGSDEDFILGRSFSGKRNARDGTATPGRVEGLPGVVRIVANSDAVSVLTAEGEVWSWGLAASRPKGLFVFQTPARVDGLPPIGSIEIASAGKFMFAIGRDGSLWAWGANEYGQLGDGTRVNSPVPRKVPIPKVVSVGGGRNNSVAVLADGTVRAWGRNDSSTMGNGQNVQDEGTVVPTPVAGITGAASVVAGFGHIIVLLKNGTMRTWGHDGWGQAGVGRSGGYQERPAAPKLTGVTAVFAPRNKCFATTSDGRLWFWGPGNYKLMGPLREQKNVPTDITALW